MARKIVGKIPDDVLMVDLERYRTYAIDLGADDAKVITVDQIIIDERAAARCRFPMCPMFGTNANCPPHAETIDETRKIVELYRYAIIMNIKVPSEDIAGPDTNRAHFKVLRKIFDIICKVESAAFADGYYFAFGYAPGPCKPIFCPDTECSVLQGKSCKASLKARSEGTGLDMYLTATKVGWDIYPCGPSIMPDEIPYGRCIALILIY